MYLGQALTRMRNIKSKLSRADKTIKACAMHYSDVTPDYAYLEEVSMRQELLQELLELKSRVGNTNNNTSVAYRNDVISLAKLILINADLRSEMAFVSSLLELSTEETSSWKTSTRTKDDIVKIFAKGYDKHELRSRLDSLELEKESVEGLIQATNAITELL